MVSGMDYSEARKRGSRNPREAGETVKPAWLGRMERKLWICHLFHRSDGGWAVDRM